MSRRTTQKKHNSDIIFRDGTSRAVEFGPGERVVGVIVIKQALFR